MLIVFQWSWLRKHTPGLLMSTNLPSEEKKFTVLVTIRRNVGSLAVTWSRWSSKPMKTSETTSMTVGRYHKWRRVKATGYPGDGQGTQGGKNDIYRLIFENNQRQIICFLRRLCSCPKISRILTYPSLGEVSFSSSLNKVKCTSKVLRERSFVQSGNLITPTVFETWKLF